MRKISIICASARSPELTQRVCNAWHDMNRGVEIQFVVPSPGFQIERAVNFVDVDADFKRAGDVVAVQRVVLS